MVASTHGRNPGGSRAEDWYSCKEEVSKAEKAPDRNSHSRVCSLNCGRQLEKFKKKCRSLKRKFLKGLNVNEKRERMMMWAKCRRRMLLY
ncbi:unnamed protein product [Caenorhabditis sp. 36 PRJEB53466]|nr:unnamed protein product [Caenorhabditis sp. 36 PRJEB53466]